MPRALPPLWLAAPGRFAGVERRMAWIVMLGFAAMLAIGLAFRADHADPIETPAIYEAVIDGMRAGGTYYDLAAQTLRAEGWPLKPFTAIRLPTHAVVQAALPPLVVHMALYALMLGVGWAWWRRLRRALAAPPARVSGAILIVAGVVGFVQAAATTGHAVWAALLVALSLALRTPERWIPSVAIGLIAMLIDETAVVAALVMAGFAWREGAMREAVGWGLALLAFALVLVAHAWAVSHVVGPLDPGVSGWPGPNGAGLLAGTFADPTALAVLPPAIAVPLAALAIFGWTAWRDPLGGRVAAMILGYAIAIAAVAGADTVPWAAIPAPILLTGLVFAPDGLRDLWVALLDRRRVRVQRVSQ